MSKSNNEELVQVRLRNETTDSEGRRIATNLVCLVDNRKDIKPGSYLTLKDSDDPTVEWKIIAVYKPIKKHLIHRTWDNNI